MCWVWHSSSHASGHGAAHNKCLLITRVIISMIVGQLAVKGVHQDGVQFGSRDMTLQQESTRRFPGDNVEKARLG